MRSHSIATSAAVALAALSMGACGGGGSGMPPPPSPTPMPSVAKCAHTFDARLALSSVRVGSLGAHGPAQGTESIVGGRLAVRIAGGRISPQVSAALAKLGAHLQTAPNEQGTASFVIPDGLDPNEAAAALRGLPGVISAGPIINRGLSAVVPVVPDDPLFGNQWDFAVTQMPAAWGSSTSTTSITIAIIDTGYDLANPDLSGKVTGSIVYDLPSGNQDTGATALDKDGHGSDVSGIAAADTNNATDVAGVAWNNAGFNAKLLEARVFPYTSSPTATTQNIANAINWAVSHGARVINLSLGSSTPDPTFEEPAVAAAISAGVVVVAASGNGGSANVDFPAADPGVIAVGASAFCDSTKNVMTGYEYVAAYSNYGSGLSLVAPGGDPDKAQINCTSPCTPDFLQWIENLDSLSGKFKEQVGLFAGTSQATPHVTGAAALMLAKNGTLSPAQVLSILKASADNIGDARQGAGRLDVANALTATP